MTPRRPRRGDSGSSLIMAMMFTTGVGLVVMALLSYGLAAVSSGVVTARVAQQSADVAGALQTAINDVRNSAFTNNDNAALPCLADGNVRRYRPLGATSDPAAVTPVTCRADPTSGEGSGATVPITGSNRPPAAVLTRGTYSSGAAGSSPPTLPSGVALLPANGPAGTTVTVSGADLAGATALQIGTVAELRSVTGVTMSSCPGGIAAAGCFVVAGSSLSFIAPPHALGVVLVSVITLGASDAASFTYMTAPAAPGTPTATAGPASATVTWSAPTDGGSPITGYVITPRRDGMVQPGIPVAASPTSTTIAGLTVASSYTFTVTAVNAVGASGPSASTAAVVPYALAAAPAQPTATAGLGRATVTWAAPADGSTAITGYWVTPFRAGAAQTAVLVPVTPTTASITGLTAGTSYTFSVAAANAAGIGPASVQSTAVVPYALPSAPVQPTATPGSATATVTWAAPNDGFSTITGYVVRSYKGGVLEQTSYFGASPLSRVVTGLTVGASYTFAVAAQNIGGTGPFSPVSAAVVPYTAPGQPAQPTATAGPSSAIVSWSAPTSDGGSTITGYVITPYKAGVAQSTVVVGATPTTKSITGLTAGASYTFTVTAQNAAGPGIASAASAAVFPYGSPSAPAQPSATAGLASATVSWSAPVDGGGTITGYVITPYKAGVAQTAVSVAATPTTAVIANLTVGSSYTFTVAAVNGAGTGPASVQSAAVIPYAVPSAPAQPTAVSGINSATLTWVAPYDGASAITGYVITPYRAGVAQPTITVGPTPTSRLITGLTAGTSYTFTVAATNIGGTGLGSAPSAAVVPYSLPDAPAQPTATAGVGSATLTWVAPYDGGGSISGYVITPYRDGVVQGTIPVAATPTTRVITGLTVGSSYSFTVAAVNAAGTGPASSPSAAVVPYAVPGAPAQPTAVAGLARATVSWTAPADGSSPISGYVVTPYKAGVAQSAVPVAATPTTTTITGLTVGSSYTFTVAAVNAAGTGPASVQSAAVVPYAVPGTPAQPTAVAGLARATVSWTAPSDGSSPITGYVVTPYKAGVAQTAVPVAATPTTTTITGLTIGSSYTFAVAAVNIGGTGPASVQSAAVIPYAVPSAPAQPTAVAGITSATVTWVAPYDGASAITGYDITPYRAGVAQSPVSVGPTPTSRTITGLTAGASYTFTVAAVNIGGTGPASAPSTAVTPFSLADAPAQPTATAGLASATVNWVAPYDGGGAITGYVITPYKDGTAQTAVSVGATPTARTITGLTVGSSYTFTVAAVNTAGTGPASVQSAAVTPYAVPSAPVQPTAVSGINSATLTWVAPYDGASAITGYVITPYRAGVAQPTITVGPTPTSRLITGLTAGTSYTFTVAATNIGGTGPASVPSTAVTPYALADAPAQPTASAGLASATVNWVAPYDGGGAITGYVITPYRDGVAQTAVAVAATPTTRTITGLTVGSSYTFTVAAVNAAGTGPASVQSIAVTPYAVPDAPAQPSAVAGITSATVTWSAPYDGSRPITGYVITPYKDGVAQTTTSVAATPTTRTLTGLTAGSSYTFTVAATNSAGTGAPSVKSAAVVPYTLPSAPAQPTATAGAASASLSWTAPANGGSAITGYLLTPYKDGVAQTVVSVGATPTTRNFPSLTVGSSYTFTVAAVNAAGNGPPSVASAAVVPYTVPSAPAKPTATAGRSSATVTWVAPFNGYSAITGYVITPYRAGIAQSTVAVAASPLTKTFSDLDIGVSYTFAVAAVNAAGSSPASPVSNAVVPFAVVPAAPAAPTAVAGYWSSTITWSAPDDGDSAITGYVVTPYKDGIASTPVQVGATPTSMVFGGLTPGASHTFTVAAKNALGTGPPSAQSNAVIPYTTPSAPARPTAAARQASALVSWTAPFNGYSAITEYVITPYRGTSVQPAITVPSSATSATIDNLVVGASYTFTVAARNAGGLGGASPASTAVVPYAVAPGAPTIGTLIAGTESVTLQWTAPADDGDSPINGYIVEGEQLIQGTWYSLGSQTFDSPATTQTYNGIPAGYVIRVRVRARNAIGVGPLSGYSNTVTINADPVLTFPSPLPAGRVAVGYNQTLTRTDGTAPFAWAVISGTLPPGLSLNTSSGVISGTPTTTGTYSFTIRLTDSSAVVVTKGTSINIQPRFALREVGRASWSPPTLMSGTGATPEHPAEPLYAVLRDPWRWLVARHAHRPSRSPRPSRRSSRRRADGLLVRGLALGTVVVLAASTLVGGSAGVAAAAGLQLFDQPFHNSSPDGTGAVVLPGTGNTACLTSSGGSGQPVLNSCPGTLDTPGVGKLRLTDTATNKAGAVFGASGVSTALGLDFTFNTYQYGVAYPADGMAFTLAAANPAAPAAPTALGPAGGPLGYTASGGVPGLPNGYLGVGFDVFGNYSSASTQGSACANPAYIGTRLPGQVVVRGPGNGTTGYCGINSTATTTSPTPAVVPLRASTRAASTVPVEVVVNLSTSTLSTASGLVVQPKTYMVKFTPVGQAARTLSGALPVVPAGLYPASWLTADGYPKYLTFGWIGTTGSNTDFHEVDEARIVSLTGAVVPALSVAQTAYAKPTLAVGDPVSYAVVTSVLPVAAETYPISVTEELPAGVVPAAAFGIGWVCQPPDGQKVTCVNSSTPFAAGTTLPTLTITAIVTTAAVTPAIVQSASIVTASSADALAVSGGETGLLNAGDSPLRVNGGVYSNSTIVSTGSSGVSCAAGWPAPDGTSGCNGIFVDDDVVAEGACTGRVVTPPTKTTSCKTGVHTLAGDDPAVAAAAAYAQPTTNMVLQPLPDCSATSSIVTFTPGYYDDAIALSARTSGAAACRGKTFWFQPGAYYFDFRNSEMPATGGLMASGSDVWTFNDASSVIVGGTKRGWTTAGVGTGDLPGACLSPLQSKTAVGVQFVFAGDSRFLHQAGGVELCGSYSATKPPVVVSGATGAGGSAARSAELVPSRITSSSVPSAPLFTPTDATALASRTDAGAGPTVTNVLKDSVATLRVEEVSGLNENISARTVLDAATVTVRHGDKGFAAGSTLKVVFRSSRPGSAVITRDLTLTYGSTELAYTEQTVDLLSELSSEVYGNGGYPFTLDIVLATSSATQTATQQLDSVRMNITWRTVGLRPQSGCVVAVGACAVLGSVADTQPANELYLQGTVHVPQSKVEISVKVADGPIIAAGVIARSFLLRSDARTAGQVYNGSLVQVPAYQTVVTPLTVYLTAWGCPPAKAPCADTPSEAGGWEAVGRTTVEYVDPSTGVVPGQRAVNVKTWQLAR